MGPCYLNKRYANRIGLQVTFELVTDLANELMGHHEDQDVSTCCSLDHIWDSHLWEHQMLMCLEELSSSLGGLHSILSQSLSQRVVLGERGHLRLN